MYLKYPLSTKRNPKILISLTLTLSTGSEYLLQKVFLLSDSRLSELFLLDVIRVLSYGIIKHFIMLKIVKVYTQNYKFFV